MVTEYPLDREERAYALLQWGATAPLAPFDGELADQGFYTAAQQERSDLAVKAWEQAHPADSGSELEAFKELERLGKITQADFYSPSKAAQGIYRSTLKSYRNDLRKDRAAEVNKGAPRRDRLRDLHSLERLQRQRETDSDPGRATDQGPTSDSSQRRTYRTPRRRTDQRTG